MATEQITESHFGYMAVEKEIESNLCFWCLVALDGVPELKGGGLLLHVIDSGGRRSSHR